VVSGIEVVYQDERLSSFTAERKFGLTLRERMKDRRNKPAKKKKPIDAVAAAVILESYLQGLGR